MLIHMWILRQDQVLGMLENQKKKYLLAFTSVPVHNGLSPSRQLHRLMVVIIFDILDSTYIEMKLEKEVF